MTKQSGLGDNFYLDGYDLSGDVGSISRVGGGPAALDVTAINKSGYERIGGVRDGAIEWSTFWNVATDQEHDALSTLVLTNRIGTYCRSTTLGNPAACSVGRQVNYDFSRENDGGLSGEVQLLSNGFGVEWGRLMTAGIRTESVATNGTGVDFAASTSFGLQAYLQVFAITSGTATIKLQESSDDGAVDTYADVTGGGFTAVTARTSERIATANNLTVERYLRVVTTGTFSGLSFAVVVVKNETAVSF